MKKWKLFLEDSWWVCWRELKRFQGQKVRIMISLVQPVIWLTLMGNMYERIALVPGFPADRYLDYMAPGIVAMVSLFGGIFGGMSVIWDRWLGFLQKLMAAPISRSSIVAGKMLAIAIQTAFQVTVIFLIAMAMGVKFHAGVAGLGALLVLSSLLSLAFAGISLAIGAVTTTHETFMAIVNFMAMPLLFTSNAVMPLNLMPAWLRSVARLNPLSYAILPIRQLFTVGWDWGTIISGTMVLGVFAAGFLVVASWTFRRASV